jgi:hypothetical protein
LAEANRLMEAGDFKSALEKHLWLNRESLSVCPDFRGVRLSFALMYWRELGEVFPPAADAMRRIRDESLSAIKSGESTGQTYLDAVAFNRELEDHLLNVELLETLERANRPRAEKLFPFVFDSLVSAEAWRTARRFIPEPEAMAAEFLFDLNQILHEYPDSSEPIPLRRKGGVFGFSRILGMLLQVLVGNDEREVASGIRALALKGVSCDIARGQIEEHLSAAGA